MSHPAALFDQIQRDIAAVSHPAALFDQIQRDIAAVSRPLPYSTKSSGTSRR